MCRIHVLMAWIAGLAGGISVVVWVAIAIATRDPGPLVEAIGPGVLTAVSATMLVRRRSNGATVLLVATAHITVTVTLTGREETMLGAALGLIVVLAVGALLVSPKHRIPYGVGTGLYALAVGMAWDGVYLGTSMMVLTALAVTLFMAVHAASRSAENRYRTLFAGVPVPLALQDWRPVRSRLRALQERGVVDVREYFAARPGELDEVMGLVRMVDVNDAFIRLAGAESWEQALEGWAVRLRSEHQREYLLDHFEALAAGSVSGDREWESHTVDGRAKWVHMDWKQMPDDALPDADRLAASTDITDLKRIESELNDLLDAKDKFVASISHELRTPLTAVLGFGESLSAGVIPPEERDEVIELLVAEARDMADIVEDLLVAARARLGEISVRSERVDLLELSSKMAKNTETGFDIEPAEGVEAIGDTTRTAQILRNLVVNAARYGGSHRRILFGGGPDTVWVEVRDDGDGIPDWLQESLFEPYVSGEARAGLAPSIGLGLWVSRELAGLMNGSLEHLRVGAETVFRLKLPRA